LPRRILLQLIFSACLNLLPFSANAEEQIIVSLTLNLQKKGDFFVYLREGGDFLVRTADLQEAGFRKLPGEWIEIDGESHVSLDSLEGVEYRFDEAALTLELTSPPELLPKATIDLSPARRLGTIYPRDNSIFLNYGIDYSAGGEDDFVFEGLTVSNELGLRHRDLLLLTDTLYTESPDDSRFVRLNTSLTWDDRQTLRRIIGGDFFASSGDLGGRVQMGGLSFSKLYRIDPYFIRYPLFDFSGLVSLPSDVELYVDGVRVRSERFAPGEFELRNFQGISGAQTIEIVVRDALGRERRIVSPVYFTDQLLRRGLHEYSYNMGLLRRDFGQESNNYSDLAFSAFHRYGLTDALNVGFRAEAGDGLANMGIESVMKAKRLGLLRLEGAGSHDGDDSGAAGFFSYEYYNRRFRGRLALQGFSEGYRILGDTGNTAGRKLNFLAGLGYATEQLGSFGVDFARSERHQGPERETLTFSWSRRLWKRTYINATFRQLRENETTHEGRVNLTWYLGRDYSVSATSSREGDAGIQVIEARRNTPIGEGTGWNVRGERSEQGGAETYQLNSVAQHNARQAILRGDFSLGRSETTTSEDLRLSLAGALVHIGDTFALTRPVTDSFALVSVGDAEGVGVYVNGQTSGHTDRRGKVIVPDLSSYYENQVSIEDKDIPMDFLMSKVRLFLSPPLRSGSCINFPLQKYQAFTGNLNVEGEKGLEPLAYAELDIETPTGPVTFWTGGEGEFYLDSQEAAFDLAAHQGCEALAEKTESFLPPGVYPLSVRQEDWKFSSEITIPPVADPFAELGEIVLPVIPVGTPEGEEAPAPPAAAPEKPEEFSLPSKFPDSAGRTSVRPLDVAAEEEPTSPAQPRVAAPAEEKAPWPAETVIHFPFDRTMPETDSMAPLAEATDYLLTHSEVAVTIEGHTCLSGNEAYNDRLGRRRAEAVRDYLVGAGIAAERISRVNSYGEHRPVCSEASEDCRRRNRRVVLRLVKTQEN
jgi:outer membrane usher protein FimD/PapC/outer membrane protein OmpA-like peptidoglycan-associated protein